MADGRQTPELALRYLGELSTDIRASAILDRTGALAAATGAEERGASMGELASRLFEEAGDGICQVEVSTAEGGVFAVREHGWTIVAVTGRFALPSLMFFDLRSVLSDLAAQAA